jgi:uncharacterized protein
MRSEFIVLVSDLVGVLGKHRTIHAEGPVSLALDHASTAGGPVALDARIDATTDGVMVRGTLTADVALTCTRCLREWVESRTAEVNQIFGFTDSEDVAPISAEGAIDLEPVVHDELAVSIPLVPRCRDDCAGLCPTCGTDLNTGSCPGHTEGLESPFAALADLVIPDRGDQPADPVGNRRGDESL